MEPKKNSKVDLTKRTVLFLQAGLIIVLLLTYLGIEWKTYARVENVREVVPLEEPDDLVIPVTEVKPTPPPKLPTPPKEIEVIPDELEKEEDEFEPTDLFEEDIVDIKDIKEAEEEEPIETVPFEFIENVPVFPGCEGLSSNAERKECMSEKITQFVNRRFNRDLGQQLGLTGINRVNILFKIDTNGNITGIQTRAPHPKLEEEAERIINALPQMTPGKQRGKAVQVSFALPIVFKVE